MFLGLGVLGSLTKTDGDFATTTASPRSTTGAIAQTPVASPIAPAETASASGAVEPVPSVTATPKPAPTPIVEIVPVDVPTSHKFSGKKQTYSWTEVALGFDKALYKVTGIAGKTKSCTVKWSMSDGVGRDGFTLKISPGNTKTRSRPYKSAVTDGAVKVTSTCKSWSVKRPRVRPPKPKACYGNPWGYTTSRPGKRINDPPGEFCSYFDCIPSFWDSTNGYVVQCRDGTFSHSGGRQGACSSHGGVRRALYRH